MKRQKKNLLSHVPQKILTIELLKDGTAQSNVTNLTSVEVYGILKQFELVFTYHNNPSNSVKKS